MDATTVGIDLAKNVFEIAIANERGQILDLLERTKDQDLPGARLAQP